MAPTSPSTIELHTPTQRAVIAARQYNNGPLSEGEMAAVNEAAAWPDSPLARLPSECSGIGCDDEPPRDPMTRRDAWLLVGMVVASLAIWAFAFRVAL